MALVVVVRLKMGQRFHSTLVLPLTREKLGFNDE
jgi:hypothetical protein